MIPSVRECFRLMAEYRMLDHIRDHSIMVARVAGLLVTDLGNQGRDLSLDIALAGALLHDIAKTATLNNDGNHAEMGRAICLRHKHDEVAEIVAEHVVLQNGVPSRCWGEKEIVYYADKRVVHDRVVSLDERLEYILERYGESDPVLHGLIRKNFRNCRLIEEKLFAMLGYQPRDIAEMVNGHPLHLGEFQL